MKTYTIIGGVNGTGKSSLTGVLKANMNLGKIIDVDKLAQQNGYRAVEAGKKAIALIDDCLDKGTSFTQETTLSGVKTLDTVKRAKESGYFIRLFYVGLDTVEECLKRIENRVAKGGHNVGSDDVARRFGNRFDSLVKILPYCDEATFFDNDNGFSEVAEYKNGEIVPKYNSPKWMNELIKIIGL
jgi:predicted ABC-type ATPase